MNRAIVLRVVLLFAPLVFSGCAHAPTPVKATLTPLTVVRDVVDAPLVSITNVFEFFADHTRPALAPGASVGIGTGGPWFGIGYDLSFFLWKGLSYAFGGVDYVIGRSLYPNWPEGISPWREPGQPWGELYWPNTKALWEDE